MENISFNDNFFSDLTELCDYEGFDLEMLRSMPDDFSIEVYKCHLEPVFEFTPQWLTERVNEERWPENDNDSTFNHVWKLLEDNIDFDKINANMPNILCPENKRTTVTKEQLIESILW